MRSEDGVNNSTASFTVASEPDTVNMTGTYRLEGSGAAAAPTIAFTPAFINKSMTVREGKLAAVVVRSRPTADGYEYTDVTEEAMYAEENAGYLSSNTVQWGANKRIRLTQSADKTFFKRGDTFTCYLYGIKDGGSVNTGGVTGANRNSILAGRALEGGTPLTTDAIPVNDGESVLLATQTVTYTSEETSAGRVTVTKEGGDFNVLMENPVRQTSIARIGWSITLTYERGGATGQVTVSSGGSSMEPVPFTLEQVSTNVYQTVLSPELLDLPDGAVVENYTVTLEFYQAVMDDDGLVTGYSTAGIEIVAGNDAVVSGTAEAGMRLTSVLNIDNGGSRRALFASLLAPKAAKSAEPTPSTSPEPTPSASPEPTPSASPEPTPSISPEPTPSISPEPTPSVSPEPTPDTSPEPTPDTSPEPTPSVSPEPTPDTSPEPTPDTSEEPTPSTGEEPTPSTGEEQPPDTGGEQEPDAGGDNTEAPQEPSGGTEGGVSEPEEN